jgi:hypothetical protein
VTTTVIHSRTVTTTDGRTCLPDTEAIHVDGVVRDLPHADTDRLSGQADLIIDSTGKVLTPA